MFAKCVKLNCQSFMTSSHALQKKKWDFRGIDVQQTANEFVEEVYMFINATQGNHIKMYLCRYQLNLEAHWKVCRERLSRHCLHICPVDHCIPDSPCKISYKSNLPRLSHLTFSGIGRNYIWWIMVVYHKGRLKFATQQNWNGLPNENRRNLLQQNSLSSFFGTSLLPLEMELAFTMKLSQRHSLFFFLFLKYGVEMHQHRTPRQMCISL